MAQHIKNLFANLIPKYETWKINLIENWNIVLGDLHEHVTLINIQNNMLILGVYDAAWLQELYILSPVLIKTINNYLGHEHITKLRFKNVGYKKKQSNVDTTIVQQASNKKIQLPLSLKEQKTLMNIQDSELRDALESYLIRCKEK